MLSWHYHRLKPVQSYIAFSFIKYSFGNEKQVAQSEDWLDVNTSGISNELTPLKKTREFQGKQVNQRLETYKNRSIDTKGVYHNRILDIIQKWLVIVLASKRDWPDFWQK